MGFGHWRRFIDLKERALWDRYKSAFETMLEKTSTNNSPWYIVPIDDKKFAQSMIAYLVRKTLEQLNPQFRELSAEEKAEMQELYHALKNEA
ncbi:MAG: hypothetical protein C4K58_04170 [Flavobacteriaceae bacterium]|nr:MAG: hypothetical protein C4K58_04170 [Flavobacteriaceae bacterium]